MKDILSKGFEHYCSEDVPEFVSYHFEDYERDITDYVVIDEESYDIICRMSEKTWGENFNYKNRDRDTNTKKRNMGEGLASEYAFDYITNDEVEMLGDKKLDNISFDFTVDDLTIELKTASMGAKAQNLPIRKYPSYDNVLEAINTKNGFPDMFVLAYTKELDSGKIIIAFDFVIETQKLIDNVGMHRIPNNQLYVYPRYWCTQEGFEVSDLNKEEFVFNLASVQQS